MIDQFINRLFDILVGYFNWPYIIACICAIWLVFRLWPTDTALMSKRLKVIICLIVELVVAFLFIAIHFTLDQQDSAEFSYKLAMSYFGVTFFYNIVVEPYLGVLERKILKQNTEG